MSDSSQTARFVLRDDDEQGGVLVEVDDTDAVQRLSRGSDGVVRAAKTLEQAVASIRPVADAVYDALKAHGPEAVEIEMGFKLTADAGAILVQTGAESHVTLKLTWQPSRD